MKTWWVVMCDSVPVAVAERENDGMDKLWAKREAMEGLGFKVLEDWQRNHRWCMGMFDETQHILKLVRVNGN